MTRLPFLALLSLPLLSLPLALACTDKGGEDSGLDDGKTDEAGAHCEGTETALSMDEDSPLGFSGDDVAAAIAGTQEATLTWVLAGDTTPLTLTLAVDGATYVDQEVVVEDDGDVSTGAWPVCPDYVRLDASLQLDSADELLADAFVVTLVTEDGSSASFSQRLAFEDFAHPEIFDDADTTDADVVEVSLAGSFAAGGNLTGRLAVWTEGSSGDGDEGVAWAGEETVATWERDGE